MFISITKELAQQVINSDKNSKEENFIISLLDMYRYGKHIVKLNPNFVSHLKTRFKDDNIIYYNQVCNIERLHDLVSISKELSISICFSHKGGINIESNIIYINYLKLKSPPNWYKSYLYLENETDWINVYSHILDWYTMKYFPNKQISNNLYPQQMGGCTEIVKKFDRLNKSNNEGFHVTIIDSDKHYPDDNGNDVAYRNINSNIENKSFIGSALMLDVSEVENLVPIEIYSAKSSSNNNIYKNVDDITKIIKTDANTYKFHDFKKGLKTAILCNDDGNNENYWKNIIEGSELKDKLNSLRRGCKKKKDKPCDTCYIVTSLPTAIYHNILEDIKHPKFKERYPQLKEEWEKIGIFLLSWGISTAQSDLELQIS